MVLYAGEAVTIIGAAYNPVAERVIDEADAEVHFYAPGKNPARRPGDRQPDKGPYHMQFHPTVRNKDGTLGAYVTYVDTTGWQPGKWTYRVRLTGLYDSWEYGVLTLKA